MKVIYSPECAGYVSVGHPESPRRVTGSFERLQKDQRHDFLTAKPCTETDLLRVHSTKLIETVRNGSFTDPDTPALPGMYQHALRSAGAAIQAADFAWANSPAFSLMRPPGHHAGRERPMGFCYFNNVAIAAAHLLALPTGPKKVAIVDFDCHHGNGTEEIFLGREDVLYVSIHQSPCYPGTGMRSTKNIRNIPVPPNSLPAAYLKAFDGCLQAVREFVPAVVAVSAGFDTYYRDPITHMRLQVDSYVEIGRRLASLRLPMFALLEGGYSLELPECIAAFLDGWEGIPRTPARE